MKIARKVGVPVACLLLAGSGTSAAAHDWGPYAPKPGAPAIPVGENVWFGDSTSHTFCYWGIDSITYAAAEDARTKAMDIPTDLRTSLDNSCPSGVDVVVHDNTPLGGFYGLHSCRSLAAANRCQTADVYLDKGSVGNTQVRRSKTLCHEFGHSVGLRHFDPGVPGQSNTEPSCMVSGYSTATRYSPHEVAHINGFY